MSFDQSVEELHSTSRLEYFLWDFTLISALDMLFYPSEGKGALVHQLILSWDFYLALRFRYAEVSLFDLLAFFPHSRHLLLNKIRLVYSADSFLTVWNSEAEIMQVARFELIWMLCDEVKI